ncbi:MAG: hypothetical protein U9N02_04390 [Campylobacterota bacterium]|nr:hypothetical protein [Campylobacterota bacterium]
MSDGLNKLKEIGAQKIYEQTHVSKEHVQAIIHNSFEDLTKVQFLGFLSILEREYNVDLGETKKSGIDFFNQLSTDNKDENKEIFVAVKEKKHTNKSVYILIILCILAVALYFSLKDSIIENSKIDNSLIQKATAKVLEEIHPPKITIKKEEKTNIVTDNNNSNDINDSKKIEKILEVEKSEEIIVEKEEITKEKIVNSLKIIPNTKLWMGYIEIDTNKHYQKVFKNALELDVKKDWLLLLGHDNVNIEVNGKIQKFNAKGNLRFSYQNNELKTITTKEFKKLNKGSKW